MTSTAFSADVKDDYRPARQEYHQIIQAKYKKKSGNSILMAFTVTGRRA